MYVTNDSELSLVSQFISGFQHKHVLDLTMITVEYFSFYLFLPRAVAIELLPTTGGEQSVCAASEAGGKHRESIASIPEFRDIGEWEVDHKYT